MCSLRRSLCTPIPEIFEAAHSLMEALDSHVSGDFESAATQLFKANDKKVWAYTEQAWGKGSAARYGFVQCADAPPHFAISERPTPRMPTRAIQQAIIARDGFHCRFCGIPVISPAVRKLFAKTYPLAVTWGATNLSQHAAFQCMWLQFDHVIPNSRGGESSLENVVVTCAPCNFGRMEATLAEARLLHPLSLDPPMVWEHHDRWDGLERAHSQL